MILSWIRGYHPTVLTSAPLRGREPRSAQADPALRRCRLAGASLDNFPPSFATEALSLRPILPARHVGRLGNNQAISLRDPARPSLRLVSSGGLSDAVPPSPRQRFSSFEIQRLPSSWCPSHPAAQHQASLIFESFPVLGTAGLRVGQAWDVNKSPRVPKKD